MKIVYFNYSSICMLLTIIFSVYFRGLYKGKQDKAFNFTVFEVLAVTIIGSITLNLDNAGPGNYYSKFVFHTLYLALHNLTTVFFIYYILSLADVRHTITPLKITLILLPTISVYCLLIINIFKPVVFYLASSDVYSRLECMPILYLMGFVNLAIALYFYIKYRKLFNGRLSFSMMFLLSLTVFSIVFEYFNPNIVIEPFANTLGLMFISYNIQQPEKMNDAQTELKNGFAYQEDCKKAFFTNKPFVQIFINITNYRLIHDIIGYETDAKVSKMIANELLKIDSEFKLHSEIYYISGGQFRMITDQKYFTQTLKASEKINRDLKETYRFSDTEVNLITNVCVARCPDDIKDIETMMMFGKDIDLAKFYNGNVLYASELYSEEYYQKLQNIDRIIERNLAKKNFEVYYQPIYSLKEKRFNSAEALLRLNDKEFGFISPELFIPAAEKTGDIHKIDNFVLEQVCSFISSDEFKELGLDYIEVNLSVAHCMQDNLPEQIITTLHRYNVNPSQINLEITETAVAQSQEKLLRNLQQLVDFGIHISLDDFGSGYSNLQRIAQLPLSIVKIDKCFTDSVKINKVSIIIQNLINLVQSLKLHIVVEGVEKEDVLRIFESYGCDYIQGFYFSKPINKEMFIQFITEYKKKLQF